MSRKLIETRKITAEESLACAKEEIQVIGCIQPHGFQLNIDPKTLKIVQYSSNFLALLNSHKNSEHQIKGPVIGTSITEWISVEDTNQLTSLSSKQVSAIQLCDSSLIKPEFWECSAHISHNWISLEFTPITTQVGNNNSIPKLDNMLNLLKVMHDENELFATLVSQIQTFTQYDRVMMYRFLPDWSGEVVAEAVSQREELKYLGLRFPAEDIPAQARKLYTLNTLRIFADIDATPCHFIPERLPNGKKFDQSLSLLRCMSNMHRAYLKNMHVKSTLTLSIISEGSLWGMIVLHHNEATIPNHHLISQLKALGELINDIVNSYLFPANEIKQITYLMNSKSLIEATFNQAKMTTISEGLFEIILTKLHKIMPYDFVGFIYNETSYACSDKGFIKLSEQTFSELMSLCENLDDNIEYFTSHQLHHEKRIIPCLEDIAGIALSCKKTPNNFHVFVGKREVEKSINWGGIPQTVDIVNYNDKLRLEPRSSFNAWRQQVKGQSTPWEEQDKKLLAIFFEACANFFSTKHSQMRMELLEKNAFYDPLTGLANRAYLKQFINDLHNQQNHNIKYISIFFIDLDNFKDINDFMGHDTGDRLLVVTAQRLKDCLKPNDFIARLGGDEFIIVLTHTQKPDECAIESISSRIINHIGQPITDNSYTVMSTPSVGVVLGEVATLNFNEALKQADIAMYTAKNSGKNRYHLFSKNDQDLFNKKAILTMDLRDSLKIPEVILHYQPKFNAQRQLVGVEALARWENKSFGAISPDVFIEIAEKNNIIYSLGLQIIKLACAQLSDWHSKQLLPSSFNTLSINISALQLSDPHFERDLIDIIEHYNLPKHLLQIEITETVFMKNYNLANERLNKLRKYGISISLDDFGTGFSSLNSLWKLPIDEVKIDKSFVCHMNLDNNLFTMVESVISLCKKLKLTVVAEGVENKIEYNLLKGLECAEYQGFLFSKALPANEFEQQFLVQ